MTDVSRESLAAAIEAIDPTELEDVLHGADAERIADAILRSLPSPAPEPPPRLLHADAPHDDCTEEGHHWHVGAAQPAPDPEAIRLLRDLANSGHAGFTETPCLCAVHEDARSFLSKSEARESGGEP